MKYQRSAGLLSATVWNTPTSMTDSFERKSIFCSTELWWAYEKRFRTSISYCCKKKRVGFFSEIVSFLTWIAAAAYQKLAISSVKDRVQLDNIVGAIFQYSLYAFNSISWIEELIGFSFSHIEIHLTWTTSPTIP